MKDVITKLVLHVIIVQDGIGGICGAYKDSSVIEKCFNDGQINCTVASDGVGASGICGAKVGDKLGIIKFCYNSGNINVSVSDDKLGNIINCGIDGGANNIYSCYNTGILTTTYNGQRSVICGGITSILHPNTRSIENCYNIGKLSTGGGIIGWTAGGDVTNCHYLKSSASKGVGLTNAGQDIKTGGIYEFDENDKEKLLEDLGADYKIEPGLNDGYPVLWWQ